MAEVGNFVIRNVIAPFSKIARHGSDKSDWKELVLIAVSNVDGELVGVGTAVMGAEDASDDCESGEAFRMDGLSEVPDWRPSPMVGR